MTRIPQARAVRQALRALRKATQGSLKDLNHIAGQQMAKGEYRAAQELAAQGSQIREFLAEIDGLDARWRELCRANEQSRQQPTTALWKYYAPILQSLMMLGGQARRSEIEIEVEKAIGTALQSGDRTGAARGRERWRTMVRSARKSLASEGWIERGSGPIWKITDAGRKAAENPPADALTKEPLHGPS